MTDTLTITKCKHTFTTFTPRSNPAVVALKMDGEESKFGFRQATDDDRARAYDRSTAKVGRWYRCYEWGTLDLDESWPTLVDAIKGIPGWEIEKFLEDKSLGYGDVDWHHTLEERYAANAEKEYLKQKAENAAELVSLHADLASLDGAAVVRKALALLATDGLQDLSGDDDEDDFYAVLEASRKLVDALSDMKAAINGFPARKAAA